MTTDPIDDQQLFADTVNDLLARKYTPDFRYAASTTELGWSQEIWADFAEIGLLGLTIPEAHGGLAAGPAAVAAVMTEIGRHLALEPLNEAVLVPARLITEAGSAEQQATLLPPLAAGTRRFAFAHLEPGGHWSSASVSTKAERIGDRRLLTGTKSLVLRGDCADTFIVSASGAPDGHGVELFVLDATAEGVRRENYTTYDGIRGARITLTGAPAEQLGTTDAGVAIERAIIGGQLALCAEAVGVMAEAVRLTVDYLKTRKQFGVPLSTFQALTHRAADMYVSLEMARGLQHYAAARFATGDADPVLAARTKLQIGRSARHIGQEAIQLHGGIGMTAEHAIGRYARRLLAIEHTYGSTEEQLRLLAAQVRNYDLLDM